MKKNNLLALFLILFVFNTYGQLNPDPGGNCNGDANNQVYALKFGSYTGENIFSNRQSNAFGNQYGLDFVTNSQYRIRINGGANGYISIGSYATPTTRLSFGPYSGTNGVSDIGNMRLSIFDYKDVMRYGIGYYEESGVSFPVYKRIFAFYANPEGRFSFFDNYSTSSTDKTNGTGYEFVSFNAANRSVGICNTTPLALLHIKSPATSSTLAIFESFEQSANITSRLNFVGNSQYGSKNYIDGYGYNKSTATQTNAPVYLQAISGGTVGIGSFPFASSTSYFTPTSLLHVQNGNVQITNSGTPPLTTDAAKIGLTLGHNGNISTSSTAANSYSWIQSSKGPLVLNPNSGNTLAGAQTNNYVAIGFIPDGTLSPVIPGGYNLIVKGKVMCEELKIKLMSGVNWPDYVFARDYKLMTVDSLQSYIAQNNHLPGVPSASEVEENGIMAGEMNAVLLKKIEELTLYMIEQNKNSATQAEQIELLKKQNELLTQQMQLLIDQTK